VSDRAFIIGAGRVGRGLARAFRASGSVAVVALHGRRSSEETTSFGEYPASLSEANVIVVAVRDSEIDGVCAGLVALEKRKAGSLAHGAVVVHTSGTAEPRSFEALRAIGIRAGTFHPLVPFATPERGAQLLHDAWIGIDGDATACSASRRVAAAVGARTVNIPAGHKAAYHAAAVVASNFPVVLAAVAGRVLRDAGVAEHTAEQVVQSLMAAAVTNLQHGSPASMLTGPVVRGDSATIDAHRTSLHGDPIALAVYDSLTAAARDIVTSRRVS
jgi:predicted short-subunit dehydrogenase-like oxidoreductase (DUF2520 family)